ncbi:MAG: hypothetical protein J0L82_10210 [Deltaproteobacteria bacterium]|jgi:hypothetical protein|nr:hypothetical protein [Deltaproteobacteria bacterium]
MLRTFAEYENDRFFEPGLLDQLFTQKGQKKFESLKEAIATKVTVDRRAWTSLMRKSANKEMWSQPQEAFTITKEWLAALSWPSEAMSPISISFNKKDITLPALEFDFSAPGDDGPLDSIRIPIVIMSSRHSEHVLALDNGKLTPNEFIRFDSAPDSLLEVLLNEEHPFVLQSFPGGVTWWRRRGTTFASFTVYFNRVLENTAARDRAEVVLPAIFSPAFFLPIENNPLKAADTAKGTSFNSYPIEELRTRFKNAMELLATAAINSVNVDELNNKKTKSNRTRLPETNTERPTTSAEQIRVECSRYLYRLLFLFSAEAKGQFQVEAKWASGGGALPVYSTYFVRKRAANLSFIRNQAWLKETTFIWDSITDLFDLCRKGSNSVNGISIPPFNGQLFEARKIPTLSTLKVPDAIMALVIDEISRVPVQRGGVKVYEYCDFSSLQVNHLGEIYQWLLEFDPKILKGPGVKVCAKAKDEPFYMTKRDADALSIPNAKRESELGNESLRFRMNPRSSVRSQTGSHFTNAALGAVIAAEGIRGIIEPLAMKGATEDILSLSILEPSIGSAGIVAQAVQIAGEYVAISELLEGKRIKSRSAFDNLPDREKRRLLQHGKRRVVERMVYGVDLKSDAVELARAALWQECATPELPLPFLNHKIRPGNAIVGTWFFAHDKGSIPRWINPGEKPLSAILTPANRERMELGEIPASLKAIKRLWSESTPGDQLISKLNMAAESQIRSISKERSKFLKESWKSVDVNRQEALFSHQLGDVLREPTDSQTLLLKTDLDFAKSVEKLPAFRKMRIVGDLATALYFWPHAEMKHYPTPAVYYRIVSRLLGIDEKPLKPGPEVEALKAGIRIGYQNSFFHWEVEFPELFLDGKKPDIVVANPPWDLSDVGESDFWGRYHPLSGTKGFSAEKVKQDLTTARLISNDVKYEKQYLQDRQFSTFLKESGDYSTLTREADLYRPFAEQAKRIAGKRCSMLLPQSLWINGTSFEIRKLLRDELGWSRLIGFENAGKKFFSSVHASYTFGVCTFEAGKKSESMDAVFRMRNTDDYLNLDRPRHLKAVGSIPVEKPALLTLSWKKVESFAKDLALPEVKSEKCIEFLAAIAKTGHTCAEWIPAKQVQSSKNDFHLSNDFPEIVKKMTTHQVGYVPVWRGGHFHIWKPYFQQEDASFEGEGTKTKFAAIPENAGPRFKPYVSLYVKEQDAEALGSVNGLPVYKQWRIAWRNVARSTDARTLLIAMVPPGIVLGNSAYILSPVSSFENRLWQLACLGSLVADANMRLFGAVNCNIPQVEKIFVVKPNSRLMPKVAQKMALLLGKEALKELYATSDAKNLPALPTSISERGVIAEELNALVAVAYSIATGGAFNRDHLSHILSTYFKSIFQDQNQIGESTALSQEAETDENEESDRGTLDPLNRDRILALFDEYMKKFGSN